MIINLKNVPNDSPLSVQQKIDASDLKRWGENPIASPVEIDATFISKNGAVFLQYTAAFRFNTSCARCLVPIELDMRHCAEHILMESVQNDNSDAFILVPDSRLDLDELVKSDLSLKLEGVVLCKQDCKGICPICGNNKNESLCECKINVHDSRFDALRMLLAEQDG